MKLIIKDSDVFIPEWNKNKSLPEAEQIKIYYKYLTTEQRKQFVYTEPLKISTEKNKDSEMELVIKQDTMGIAKTSVYRIDGIELSDGKKIDTIQKLYSTIDSCDLGGLISEIEGFLLNANKRIDEKN